MKNVSLLRKRLNHNQNFCLRGLLHHEKPARHRAQQTLGPGIVSGKIEKIMQTSLYREKDWITKMKTYFYQEEDRNKEFLRKEFSQRIKFISVCVVSCTTNSNRAIDPSSPWARVWRVKKIKCIITYLKKRIFHFKK